MPKLVLALMAIGLVCALLGWQFTLGLAAGYFACVYVACVLEGFEG